MLLHVGVDFGELGHTLIGIIHLIRSQNFPKN